MSATPKQDAAYALAIKEVVEALRELGRGPEGKGSNYKGLIYDDAADLIESRFPAPSDPCTDCDGTGIGGHGGTCPTCKGSKSAPSPGPEGEGEET